VRSRSVAIALAGAAAALVAAGTPAAIAHARLTGSVPADGARVARPPGAVELVFDEAVEDRLAAATLVDARGRSRPLALRAAPNPGRLVFDLPARVPAGRSTIRYRVVSTDGHPLTGAFGFAGRRSRAAGSAGAGGAPATDRATAANVPSRVLDGARAAQYAAIAIVLGGTVFVLLVWLPAAAVIPARERRPLQRALARRWRRPAAAATALGAVSAAIAVGAQVAVDAGSPAPLALDGAGVALATRAGTAWLLALSAWLVVAVVLAATRVRPEHPRGLLALALPLAVLAVVPATSGHAGRAPGLVAANVVHVCAISTWLGGLVALVLALRVIGARRPGPAGAPLLHAVADRFSVLALAAIAAVVITGTTQSALLLGAAADLVGTSYGRLIIVKGAVTLAVLALGARQRAAIATRALPAGATMHAEVLLGLLAIATTALLAGEAAHGG
jgi:copper transport protein